jgi:hypothetical protein
MIVWLDSERAPTIIEFIVHKSYYERSANPRTRVLGLEVKLKPAGRGPLVEDSRFLRIHNTYDGGELGFDSQGNPRARPLDSIFYGVIARVYPESIWRTIPALADHLRGLTDTTVLEWKLVRKIARTILGQCPAAEVGAGDDVDCEGSFDARPYSRAMTKENNVWSIDESTVGVERYYLYRRYDATAEGCSQKEDSCDFHKYRFRISYGAEELSLRGHESRFVFDAHTRRLALIIPKIFATQVLPRRPQ